MKWVGELYSRLFKKTKNLIPFLSRRKTFWEKKNKKKFSIQTHISASHHDGSRRNIIIAIDFILIFFIKNLTKNNEYNFYAIMFTKKKNLYHFVEKCSKLLTFFCSRVNIHIVGFIIGFASCGGGNGSLIVVVLHFA